LKKEVQDWKYEKEKNCALEMDVDEINEGTRK
jgi:hypothetical protein